MKKIFIASIMLAVALFISTTAFAVVIDDQQVVTPTSIATNAYEEANFLVADNKVCGLLYKEKVHEMRSVNIEQIGSQVTFSKDAGKLVRFKGSHQATLTEDYRIKEGGTKIQVRLEILNAEALATVDLVNPTADDIVDKTIEGNRHGDGTYLCFSRFLDTNAGIEVARLYFQNGKYASIRLADWNQDGKAEELCFRAGTKKGAYVAKPSGGSSGGSNSPSGDAPVTPPADDGYHTPEYDEVVDPPFSDDGGNDNYHTPEYDEVVDPPFSE